MLIRTGNKVTISTKAAADSSMSMRVVGTTSKGTEAYRMITGAGAHP